MREIKILIADDQRLICEGISIILESTPDIRVVATAYSGREAVAATLKHQPDVVLMDIQMPELTGIEALKEIKSARPQTVVLMLTTFDPDEYILTSIQNGADGYLMKDLSGERLASAIRDAYVGNVIIPASIAARLITRLPANAARKCLGDYGLSAREQEIAELIAQGYDNQALSKSLGLSVGTVKNYASTIYAKLEVDGRQQAALLIAALKTRNR